MRDKIETFLYENDFEYDSDVLGVTVDCGGRDYLFLTLIALISENISEWTYEDCCNGGDFKIDVDCARETVRFTF